MGSLTLVQVSARTVFAAERASARMVFECASAPTPPPLPPASAPPALDHPMGQSGFFGLALLALRLQKAAPLMTKRRRRRLVLVALCRHPPSAACHQLYFYQRWHHARYLYHHHRHHYYPNGWTPSDCCRTLLQRQRQRQRQRQCQRSSTFSYPYPYPSSAYSPLGPLGSSRQQRCAQVQWLVPAPGRLFR